jgi:hypothetical protein
MDIYIPKFLSQKNRPTIIYNITTKVDDESSSSFIGELHKLWPSFMFSKSIS